MKKPNYLLDLIIKDLYTNSKEHINSIKSKIKDVNLDDLLGHFTNSNTAPNVITTPTVNDSYSLIIDAPGFNKSDLNINHDKHEITIIGNILNRTINIAINVGNDTINKVTLELGVLTIIMNKIEENKSTKVNID